MASCFRKTRVRQQLALAPCDLDDAGRGVRRHLDELLLNYSVLLGGVPLAYSRMRFEQPYGLIHEDRPAVHVGVHADLLLFAPKVGDRLVGVVNQVSSDHIGLLVHGIFNASIAASLVSDVYEFDRESLAWADKAYDKPRLAAGAKVAFTVHALETANGILSIVGKMQGADTGLVVSTPTAPSVPKIAVTTPSADKAAEKAKKKSKKERTRTAAEADETQAAKEASASAHKKKKTKKEKKQSINSRTTGA